MRRSHAAIPSGANGSPGCCEVGSRRYTFQQGLAFRQGAREGAERVMSQGRPLVEVIRSIIQGTYDLPRVIGEVGPYIVGDEGFRRLYGGCPDPSGQAGALLLVRQLLA